MPPKTANAQQNGGGPAAGQVPVVPFTAAAHEHTELAFDKLVELGANAVPIGPFDVPAYGYLRNIVLVVEGTGGALGGGTLTEDWPFNILSNIQLSDVNGTPLFGPLDGYATLWTNIWGGYAGRPDPRSMPFYNATVNPKFIIRIPAEISHRDGFGSLANQNAAASYKVYLTMQQLSKVITGGAPTTPKLRVRGYLEAWSLPNEVDLVGRRQAEAPPMLGTGQYHSYFQAETQKGANTKLLPKMGNLIRYIGIIARNAAGVRKDAAFFDPVEFQWDARQMWEDSQLMLTERMASSIPELKTRDEGVFAYLLDRSTKNTVGDDAPTLWYPTVQSTRMQIGGNAEEAGSLQVITNDVQPVAVAPQERFVENSQSGFHPAVGAAPSQGTR